MMAGIIALFIFVVAIGEKLVGAEVHKVAGTEPDALGSWAAGRIFRVGDRIWFAYTAPNENIVELKNEDEYQSCDVSNPIKMFTDKVPLDQDGTRYFASANAESCKQGLKLHVHVNPLTTEYSPPSFDNPPPIPFPAQTPPIYPFSPPSFDNPPPFPFPAQTPPIFPPPSFDNPPPFPFPAQTPPTFPPPSFDNPPPPFPAQPPPSPPQTPPPFPAQPPPSPPHTPPPFPAQPPPPPQTPPPFPAQPPPSPPQTPPTHPPPSHYNPPPFPAQPPPSPSYAPTHIPSLPCMFGGLFLGFLSLLL